ncbi:FG-GAP-like repeat-containing protein, partial [Acinetobacter baumannii]
GYPDIFIGSRSEPQQYGIIPRSFIFHNNRNGAFEDVTAQVAPFLNNLGMITSAVYADINGDAQKELIITGDYMGVQAFSYVNK